jgi:DegV family protein with EDD domain
MSTIAIVSDSTASLSEAYVRAHGIHVVPLYLRIDDATYRDGVDISPSAFYERLPRCSVLPTTSQPSVGDFAAVYRQALAGGAAGIISVHLSSGISGTVNSARLAAEQLPDAAIEIVDTQCAAAAQQIVIEAVVAAVERGAGFAEACGVAQRAVAEQRTVFTVDTLEYLYKGGRIGGAAALFGSLLQFKPLLHFEEGKITALERVRKATRAVQRMVEIMEGWMPAGEPVRAVIMQAACPERAGALEGLLRASRIPIAEADIVPLSPVIGTHVGNGTLGICCLPMSVWAGGA